MFVTKTPVLPTLISPPTVSAFEFWLKDPALTESPPLKKVLLLNITVLFVPLGLLAPIEPRFKRPVLLFVLITKPFVLPPASVDEPSPKLIVWVAAELKFVVVPEILAYKAGVDAVAACGSTIVIEPPFNAINPELNGTTDVPNAKSGVPEVTEFAVFPAALPSMVIVEVPPCVKIEELLLTKLPLTIKEAAFESVSVPEFARVELLNEQPTVVTPPDSVNAPPVLMVRFTAFAVPLETVTV